MFRVLVVEDDPLLEETFREAFDSRIELVFARTTQQAEAHLAAYQDFALVVMDGYLEESGRQRDTLELVRHVRSRFHGPILATSSSRDMRRQLLACGCTGQAEKWEVPDKVRQLLGLV